MAWITDLIDESGLKLMRQYLPFVIIIVLFYGNVVQWKGSNRKDEKIQSILEKGLAFSEGSAKAAIEANKENSLLKRELEKVRALNLDLERKLYSIKEYK